MDTDKKELGAQLAYAALVEVPNSKADVKEQQSRKPAVRKRLIFNLKYGCRNTVAMMQVSDRGRKGRHDSRRHALAMLRIAAVLSSLNCILRRNYLAKDRRAQNALLVSWCPSRPLPLTCKKSAKLYVRQTSFTFHILHLFLQAMAQCNSQRILRIRTLHEEIGRFYLAVDPIISQLPGNGSDILFSPCNCRKLILPIKHIDKQLPVLRMHT